MFEGARHRGSVSSLHSNRNLLDHVGSGEWIPRHPDKPSAQLSHKFLRPWAKQAWGLNGEWSHMVGPGQLFVLVALRHLSWCGHCPCLPRCQHHMGHRIGVWAGNVPDKSLAHLPRSDGHSIRTFTVQPTQTHRLQRRWNLCSSKGHLDNGVDRCMPWEMSCTHFAA